MRNTSDRERTKPIIKHSTISISTYTCTYLVIKPNNKKIQRYPHTYSISKYKPSCSTLLRSTHTCSFRYDMQIGAESTVNRPTPRVRAIRQLSVQPSALSMMVCCMSTIDHLKQLYKQSYLGIHPYISAIITINNTTFRGTHVSGVSGSIHLRVPHLYEALIPVCFDTPCK